MSGIKLKTAAGGSVTLQPENTGVDVTLTVPADNSMLMSAADLAAGSGSSLVGYTPAGTGAVATTVQSKLREVVSVLDFGASPSATAAVNDAAFAAALASITRGTLAIPPGVYNTSVPLEIANKNNQNDSTQSNLEIIANGAKIVSSVTGSTPALRIVQCKRLKIVGLEVSAPSTTVTVDVQGMWNSTWSECLFGTVSFGGNGYFDSHYWNKFEKCQFDTLTIDTGAYGGDRSEFNSNTFDTCRLWGSDYAIKKYGSHLIEDVVFLNCDFSYQSTGILYIDEACGGTITLIGGYLDSAAGMPTDTKGIRLNIVGPVYNPNDANVKNFLLSNGSASECRGFGGTRSGQRSPMSAFNLIKNGDLRAGLEGISTSNLSAAINSGPGVFGKYVNISTSTAFGSAAFQSIPLPFTGTYTLTVIGRANTKSSEVIQCAGIYAPVYLDSDWTVSSFSFIANQGTTQSLNFTNGATGSFNYDIAYVGLTYGGVGQLFAPIHPSADLYTYPYTPKALSGSKTTTSQAATIASIGTFGNNQAMTFTVRAQFLDGSYPQYVASCVYLCTIVKAQSRSAVVTLTQLQAAKDGLDITPVPVITSSVASDVVTLTASVSPGTSGEATCKYEIFDIMNSSTATITML